MEENKPLDAQVSAAQEHLSAGELTAGDPNSILQEHSSAGELMAGDPNSIQGSNNSGAGEAGPVASSNIARDEIVNSNPDGSIYHQNSSFVPPGVNGMEYESKNITEAPVASEGAGSLDEGSQGAATSTYPTEYSSLNGDVSEMPNYQSGGVTLNEGVPNEMAGPVLEQSYEDVIYSAEEDRLWNMVRVNCLDFNAWTALIEETEKVAENNIIKIRKVYDAFLSEFPLCFGYWKKYADHEGRLDSVEKVVEVYERAVMAVTYSVDIWVSYCQFAISTYEDQDIIRRLFERGLAYIGTDYRSDILWDEYIRYEESQQAWSHLAMIYTRILEHPIQQLDRYFNCFKELAATRHLSEICTSEEAAMLLGSTNSSAQVPEREVHPDGVDQSLKPVSEGLTEAEELQKYVAIREEMYKKAKEYDSKIVGFETAIRRPYFHVKPLDIQELENWHSYLDFIEGENDFNKVIKLYERCVIACANYPEFWIRYVLFMEASGSIELVNNALARATQVFVKKQPEIHLFAARFKELSGDASGARASYQYLYLELFPGLLEAVVKHANMEYRLGDRESAFSVYEKAIAAEKGKPHSHILPMLLVQYSRFLHLVAGDMEKAREILEGALEQVQVSKPILEAIIHLESISPSQKRIEFIDSLVDKFITPDPNSHNGVPGIGEREEISSIFLEFLDLFGDAQAIKKADNRHATHFQRQKSIVVSKKRRADEFLVSEKDKVAKTGDPAESIMGAYPNAPHSYTQKSPVWPATSQTQGQQWGATYTPQAGYSAYGGYANYGHQMPQSTPPAAAYGGYPTAYSAQAYPPQNYAPPAAAPAAFPPQPATAPQTYYGTYY